MNCVNILLILLDYFPFKIHSHKKVLYSYDGCITIIRNDIILFYFILMRKFVKIIKTKIWKNVKYSRNSEKTGTKCHSTGSQTLRWKNRQINHVFILTANFGSTRRRLKEQQTHKLRLNNAISHFNRNDINQTRYSLATARYKCKIIEVHDQILFLHKCPKSQTIRWTKKALTLNCDRVASQNRWKIRQWFHLHRILWMQWVY